MAIVFQTPLPTDKWLFSANNLIVEFNSNTASDALFCDIEITGLTPVRLYPLPNNSFWGNLKEYIGDLLNDYDDNLDLTVDPLDIDSFVKDWNKILFNLEIEFTITLANETTESASVTPFILLGGEQVYKFKRGETVTNNVSLLLSPLKPKTSNRYYLKYWDGYPFDIGYTLAKGTTSQSQTITNNTNGITSPSVLFPQLTSRLVISDGDTTESLEDYLPLVQGYNELEFANEIFVDFIKDTGCEGVYIKWLNQYGGYSYWLFNRFFKVDKKIRDKGEINNDFFNLSDTISTNKQLGKDSFDEWQLLYDTATSDDRSILEGVYTSPKVYLFTGQKFTKNNFNDWLEIKVNASTVNLIEPKKDNNNFDLRIELPQDYNISL